MHKAITYNNLATESIAPREYGQSERSKLRLFDTNKNIAQAQVLYNEAKKTYDYVLATLPKGEYDRKLDPTLQKDLTVNLQSAAKQLCEAASWYTPAYELLHQGLMPLAQKHGISLNTKPKLSEKECIKESFTEKAAIAAADATTFGAYTIYSQMTK